MASPRQHVVLFVNSRRYEVDGHDAFLSLSDFVRRVHGLTGTKIVCSEGDCGACSVLVGRPTADGQRFEYRPIDACIQFIFQLDGTHVVTVEGLTGEDGNLHPVQQSMIDCHGSQCGFCTPGFVTAMAGMLEQCDTPTEADWRYSLTGNLCRCTGYTPILQAGAELDRDACPAVEEVYPPGPMLTEFSAHAGEGVEVTAEWGGQSHRFFSPPDLDAALAVLAAHPEAHIVAGATDVGVQINKSLTWPETILDLNRVAELTTIEVRDNQLVAGGRANWTDIEQVFEDLVPEFHQVLTLFGSPQIRHVGTIGGNIANASPIADSLPFLHVAEAVVELQSAAGTREVNINDFYQGYKQFDLQPGELIARVHIPLPIEGDLLRLYKVSRRRDLDISSFTAAVRVRLDGNTIADAAIAFGAVGPTIIRARQTEDFLRGRPLDEATMRSAGSLAVDEITPISDVRGSADYRYQLTRNILLKFYHETLASAVPA